jgi:prepilin-type N-terminal cleavage/methylation domain-containing protein
MPKENGFTILELMVVIAILATLTAIAMPSFFSRNSQSKLSGAANNLRGDLQMAKSRAMRENAIVVVDFTPNGYTIFLDNGVNAGDWNRDADEVLLRSIQLPAGTNIVLPTTFNPPNNRTRFNGRGFPDSATLTGVGMIGTVKIQNSNGRQRQIILNRLGRITTLD